MVAAWILGIESEAFRSMEVCEGGDSLLRKDKSYPFYTNNYVAKICEEIKTKLILNLGNHTIIRVTCFVYVPPDWFYGSNATSHNI